ncbi:hypothetical protein KI387_001385 [Taxus chinensis]|uniref:Transcription termination factor n=1 Tax=Taxus chinensis TaxID=29808 RepID=A0AA38GUT4_TAXCH|nr:hypothetical protein KI387_001385 [Taxus chinensis]
MAMSISDFLHCPLAFPPRVYLIVSKISIKISCNAVSTNPLSEDVQEQRQRRHNAMKTFLVKECGFTPSQLATVMSKDPTLFRTKSTERAQHALQLLRDSGFTTDQVRRTIFRHSCVLAIKVDEKLKPKIELFKTLGIVEDVGHVISKHPRILSSSLGNNLAPKIPLLIKLFGSKDNFSKAVRRAPFILLYDIRTLEKKFRDLKTFGLREHEINELVVKYPLVLAISKDKLGKNMNFLTNTARFSPSIVVTYNQFLGFSVEKRMIPRHMVFKYLTETLNAKHLTISLVTMLCICEQEFVNQACKSRNKLKPWVIAVIVVADIAGLLILSLLFLYVYRKGKINKGMESNSVNKMNSFQTPSKVFPDETFVKSGVVESGSTENSSFLESCKSDTNNIYNIPDSKLVFIDGSNFELEELLRASVELMTKGNLGTVYRAIMDNFRLGLLLQA